MTCCHLLKFLHFHTTLCVVFVVWTAWALDNLGVLRIRHQLTSRGLKCGSLSNLFTIFFCCSSTPFCSSFMLPFWNQEFCCYCFNFPLLPHGLIPTRVILDVVINIADIAEQALRRCSCLVVWLWLPKFLAPGSRQAARHGDSDRTAATLVCVINP